MGTDMFHFSICAHACINRHKHSEVGKVCVFCVRLKERNFFLYRNIDQKLCIMLMDKAEQTNLVVKRMLTS
jgi:hypothetical protein